jgi:hypothetical protein
VGIEIGRIDVEFDHLVEIRTNRFQTFLEILEYLPSLNLDVTLSYNIPVSINRGLASDEKVIPTLHNLGKPRAGIPKAFGL